MNNNGSHSQLSSKIINKAKELGANLAGITSVDELKDCPSCKAAAKIPRPEKVVPATQTLGLKPGEISWPEGGKSVIVIALSHPESNPELDWWYGEKSPQGNKILINIINELGKWIRESYRLKTYHMPYYVEKGGIYLKDAAVMAGLGCIGKNNLLVTPEYGPRIRLRAMIIDKKIDSTGPIPFDPCSSCEEFCLTNCPLNAFDNIVHQKEAIGIDNLPGRIGDYDYLKCNMQMKEDVESTDKNDACINISGKEMYQPIKYCRTCEFACPVGK